MNPGPAPAQTVRSRVQEDFAQIAQSLQSNNLSGAQRAYSDLVQATPASSGSTGKPIRADLASLGSALQSGSVSQAKTAFTKLETDVSTAVRSQITGATAAPITAGSIFGALVKTGLTLLG